MSNGEYTSLGHFILDEFPGNYSWHMMGARRNDGPDHINTNGHETYLSNGLMIVITSDGMIKELSDYRNTRTL